MTVGDDSRQREYQSKKLVGRKRVMEQKVPSRNCQAEFQVTGHVVTAQSISIKNEVFWIVATELYKKEKTYVRAEVFPIIQ